MGKKAMASYQRERLVRIEGNKRKMQDMGIIKIKKSMEEDVAAKRKRASTSSSTPAAAAAPVPSEPARRSARLRSCPAPCYAEDLPRERSSPVRKRSRNPHKAGTGGFEPEVYTEEHDALLGCAKEEWKVYVDGYENGVRMRDPINGKSCHQCRQKSLGLRTFCNGCKSGRGKICGDCLYMRYGENILEALADKSWSCPMCRGICNCSNCRTRKHWIPTGNLYPVVKRNYKSVAHFLIATRRGGNDEIQIVADESEGSDDGDAGDDDDDDEDGDDDDDDDDDDAAEDPAPAPAPSPPAVKPNSDDDVLVISDSEDDEDWKQKDAAAKKQKSASPQHVAGRLRSRRVQPRRLT